MGNSREMRNEYQPESRDSHRKTWIWLDDWKQAAVSAVLVIFDPLVLSTVQTTKLAWKRYLDYNWYKDQAIPRSKPLVRLLFAGVMATLLHSESRRLYSWWWDSHISPKNSKWLQENLTGYASYYHVQSFMVLPCFLFNRSLALHLRSFIFISQTSEFGMSWYWRLELKEVRGMIIYV
ncbi:Protein NETWORKED 1A, partial [Cucurbita argyrosperma subsp. argyrosperma]